MITFYRNEHCASCADIQEILDDMVLAHETVVLGPNQPSPLSPEGAPLPALVDEGRVYQGQQAILAHLKELRDFKQEWEKFQSDACYCDEDGNVI